MAKNTGSGYRRGAVRQRDQVYNPRTETWTKRDEGGRFMDGKADGESFKGVRKSSWVYCLAFVVQGGKAIEHPTPLEIQFGDRTSQIFTHPLSPIPSQSSVTRDRMRNMSFNCLLHTCSQRVNLLG